MQRRRRAGPPSCRVADGVTLLPFDICSCQSLHVRKLFSYGFVKVRSTKRPFIFMLDNHSIFILEVVYCSFHHSKLFCCALVLPHVHSLLNPIDHLNANSSFRAIYFIYNQRWARYSKKYLITRYCYWEN